MLVDDRDASGQEMKEKVNPSNPFLLQNYSHGPWEFVTLNHERVSHASYNLQILLSQCLAN